MTKMIKSILAALAASAAVTISGTTGATELNFSYTAYALSFEFQADWTQPSAPTPVSYMPGQSTEIAVVGTETILFNGLFFAGGPISNVTFNSLSNGGGFNDGLLTFDNGPQIYTGTESNPVFSPNVFNLLQGVLTVTPAVPEPTTWMMMLVGFGAVGCAARRRQNVNVSYG